MPGATPTLASASPGPSLLASALVHPPATRRRAIAGLMAGTGTAQALLLLGLYVGAVVAPDLARPPDLLTVLVYDPPPPPPPPLPKGSPLQPQSARPAPARPVVESPSRRPSPTIAIPEPLADLALVPEAGVRAEDQFGSPLGSLFGDPLGMEEGVPGGVVGGQPGGVLGGVPWGTGTGPVADFDTGPRPLRQTRPTYPQEAFVKRVEGTVVVEILIDASGRVTPVRVLRSIPLLDEAARVTVTQWLFQPATKRGRPVATFARAPVTFTIF